jgi:thioredoxin 1
MAQTFSEIIQSNKPVLVDFYADWCGPCRMMKPILENVKQKVGDNATIIKVDVDKNSTAAATYDVTSIPTLMIFQKGEVKWRQAGVVQANQLIQELNNYKNL